MIDPVEDVAHFQKTVLKYEFPEKPTKLRGRRLRETAICLNEEIDELFGAANISDQADALIDLIYFAFGALYQMGVPARKVWDEVHRANITKKRGITERGNEIDAAKPEGWTPPDHSWLDKDAE